MKSEQLFKVCPGNCPSCKRMGFEHHYVPVEPDQYIDEIGDKARVFSIARHAAKRYLELCGQGDGAWGRVTEFLDDAALGIGGDDE